MTVKQLNSHYLEARERLEEGSIDAAVRKAELAVDEFWRDGDSRIAEALPLLSFLRHKSQIDGDIFTTLDDLPASFYDALLAEATHLHQQRQESASKKMLSDVDRFLRTCVADSQLENAVATETPDSKEVADEKITDLRSQIVQFYADGKRELAVEASLELANEYAIRGKDRRAFNLYLQVLKKSKRPDRSKVRVNSLLDFGRFMSRIGKTSDAERLLRVAAGVAKKSADSEKFAQAVASLGVVLMHRSKNESAKKFLEKAHSMLSPWDVESDKVNDHLEALRSGTACDCPEAATEVFFDAADWD